MDRTSRRLRAPLPLLAVVWAALALVPLMVMVGCGDGGVAGTRDGGVDGKGDGRADGVAGAGGGGAGGAAGMDAAPSDLTGAGGMDASDGGAGAGGMDGPADVRADGAEVGDANGGDADAAGDANDAAPACPTGQACRLAGNVAGICANDNTCAMCAADTACKSAYTTGHICMNGGCVTGDCHDTSSECTAGRLCGVATPHTCGACTADAQCAGDAHYGTGNICVLGVCQPGNCHSTSAECTGAKQGQICGATAANTCGACTSDGQCQSDTNYGNGTICHTAAGSGTGTCVSAACATNRTGCTANAGDFCCGGSCVAGNCCDDSDCTGNPTFGPGFACVAHTCSQCAAPTGNSYFVDPLAGNDQTGTGSGMAGGGSAPSCAFQTITHAIGVIGNSAPPGTKLTIVGRPNQTVGLTADDTLPITLPPNVTLSTAGGAITIALPSSPVTSTAGFHLLNAGSGIVGGGASAPLILDGNGHQAGIGIHVAPTSGSVALSNVTIQDTGGHAITVMGGTVEIGPGVVATGAGTSTTTRDGLLVLSGVANITVPGGAAPSSFSANSLYGIEVTPLGSVNVIGTPTAQPTGNGTVMANGNLTGGLRIAQTPGMAGLLTSSINGLVAWANNSYGARLQGGSKVMVRNSVFLSNGANGVLVNNNGTTPDGNDFSAINLGTVDDYGHNWLQAPLGVLGTNLSAGLCVATSTNQGSLTLQAAGNVMVAGTGTGTQVDCSMSAATVTRGACTNRNSVGVTTATGTTVNVITDNCL